MLARTSSVPFARSAAVQTAPHRGANPHVATPPWNALRLKLFLRAAFPNQQLIVASHRQPYSHVFDDFGVALKQPASGLITAMEPVMRASGGTWVAHSSGNADAQVTDREGIWLTPAEAGRYRLKRLWFSKPELQGHIDGFSNAGLWPLCHDAEVVPEFTESDWQMYRRVNQAYADAIVAEARCANPVAFIHDYQLALVPAMVRKLLPCASVLSFWHIPWAKPEQLRECPCLPELIEGWLGSDLAGFQTPENRNNFLVAARQHGKRSLHANPRVLVGAQHTTLVNDYPASIAWPSSNDCVPLARPQTPPARSMKLVVGVDRFDYTKGLLQRMLAFEALLTSQPQWLGRLRLIQVAAPTRGTLAAYRRHRSEVTAEVARINQRFAQGAWQPISLFDTHHNREELNALYQSADVCLVSSLQDGMNLVCKEFVAARSDEKGVLVLSQFAGARDELTAALIVNPRDIPQVAQALQRALTMPAQEVQRRMRAMRRTVKTNNVHRWAANIFMDAARLRVQLGLDPTDHALHQLAQTSPLPEVDRRAATSNPSQLERVE